MTRTTPLPALQQRDFRLLWIGQLFSTVGSQMQLIVVNWHVYLLLRGQVDRISLLGWHFSLNAQAVGLGMLGAVRILPIFLFAFLGGAIADHRDRRHIILWSQILACLCAALLGLLTLRGNITIGLLYLFTAIDAGINAFNEPAQISLYPELIPAEHLQNAATLFALLWQVWDYHRTNASWHPARSLSDWHHLPAERRLIPHRLICCSAYASSKRRSGSR